MKLFKQIKKETILSIYHRTGRIPVPLAFYCDEEAEIFLKSYYRSDLCAAVIKVYKKLEGK